MSSMLFVCLHDGRGAWESEQGEVLLWWCVVWGLMWSGHARGCVWAQRMRLVGDVCAGNCLAYGPGLEAATCNVGAEFTVELKDELGNRIMRREEVSVAVTHQASKSKVEAGVSRQQDGTYQVLYTPEQQGEYAIEVAVGKTGIQGSPFKVLVDFGKVDGSKCRAFGPGLEGAVLGEAASFTVEVRDEHGNLRSTGGDAVDVVVKAGRGNIPAQVEDNKDGTYCVEYTATMEGQLQISVTVDRQAVKGSPFSVDVAGVPSTVDGLLRL